MSIRALAKTGVVIAIVLVLALVLYSLVRAMVIGEVSPFHLYTSVITIAAFVIAAIGAFYISLSTADGERTKEYKSQAKLAFQEDAVADPDDAVAEVLAFAESGYEQAIRAQEQRDRRARGGLTEARVAKDRLQRVVWRSGATLGEPLSEKLTALTKLMIEGNDLGAALAQAVDNGDRDGEKQITREIESFFKRAFPRALQAAVKVFDSRHDNIRHARTVS